MAIEKIQIFEFASLCKGYLARSMKNKWVITETQKIER